jgi:hypothetical protein
VNILCLPNFEHIEQQQAVLEHLSSFSPDSSVGRARH